MRSQPLGVAVEAGPVEQRELALVLQQQLPAAVDPLALDHRGRQQPDQAAPAEHAEHPRRRHLGEQLGELLPPARSQKAGSHSGSAAAASPVS